MATATALDYRSAPLSALPKRGDCFDRRCITREILSHVAGRWSMLIIAALQETPVLRFSQLRKRIDGISEKMLSEKLRDLERDGLIARRSLPVVPPHVEYRLTPMGIGVASHVDALVEWIQSHARQFVSAQRKHDAACG